jgi:hypothetical protein
VIGSDVGSTTKSEPRVDAAGFPRDFSELTEFFLPSTFASCTTVGGTNCRIKVSNALGG